MSTLLIEGGHRLGGRVSVEGNKNAALPLLAACLLTDEECVLTNVPRIGDVEVMARLLLDLGVEVHGIGTTTLRISAKQVRTHAPNRSLVGRLRGSVLLLGPLLARTGRAHIAPPGGDFPARRSISTHLGALQAMGARIVSGDDHFLETPDGLTNASMYLDEASVTGTETALLAAASARGPTEIRHAATEPHVVELCEFLSKMGAVVHGIGSSKLRIEGVSRLHGAQHRLGGDYIEAGSWAVIAAITGGEIAIDGAREDDIEVVASVLKRMNVQCGMRDGTFEVKTGAGRSLIRAFVFGGSDWRLARVLTADGADLIDAGLDVPANGSVDGLVLEMTPRHNQITGTVVDAAGEKVRDCVVVFFAQDPLRWTPNTRYYGVTRPDAESTFHMRLPAGNYLAAAFEDSDPVGQYAAPEILQQLRDHAIAFTIGETEKKTIELPLGSPPIY